MQEAERETDGAMMLRLWEESGLVKETKQGWISVLRHRWKATLEILKHAHNETIICHEQNFISKNSASRSLLFKSPRKIESDAKIACKKPQKNVRTKRP